MRANREEIELLYENKIKNLTSHAQRNSGAANLAIEELRQTRARIDSLNQRINELEASNNALNSRIRFVDSSDSSQFCTLSKRISLIVVVNMLKGLGELARERESSSYRRFGRVGGWTGPYARRNGTTIARVSGSYGHQGRARSWNCGVQKTLGIRGGQVWAILWLFLCLFFFFFFRILFIERLCKGWTSHRCNHRVRQCLRAEALHLVIHQSVVESVSAHFSRKARNEAAATIPYRALLGVTSRSTRLTHRVATSSWPTREIRQAWLLIV